MQIVIDIDDKVYELVKHFEKGLGLIDKQDDTVETALMRAIINGTPLPKGHGDLKDINNLKHVFSMWSMAAQGNFTDVDIASIVCNSPTIIKADEYTWKGYKEDELDCDVDIGKKRC